MKRKLVVFTGAGISAASGLATFRGANGLWEGYRIEDVATPEAWAMNPQMVTEFYNQRRLGVAAAKPNKAHNKLNELEALWDVQIITQNIDDLHERAGSKNVVHLHGEVMKMRSQVTQNTNYCMNLEDKCPNGFTWRPHVVWFGEAVPKMDEAIELVLQADVFLVIGTSLQVYPAAGLLNYVSKKTPIILLDPEADKLKVAERIIKVAAKADEGIDEVVKLLLTF
jgi:NAD-dependent deacetylase